MNDFYLFALLKNWQEIEFKKRSIVLLVIVSPMYFLKSSIVYWVVGIHVMSSNGILVSEDLVT